MEKLGALVFAVTIASPSFGCVSYEDSAAVFDRTKLHSIEITVDDAYLHTLETDLVTRVPCTVSYDGEVVEGAGIRQKGNEAKKLRDDNPSFSIKFNEGDSAATLSQLKKILLNGSNQDESFMREMIASDLYAKAGVPAPRIAHAQVRLNGLDMGIFIVAEAVNGGFLYDRFGGDVSGGLYEGPCCGDFVDNVSGLVLDDEEEGSGDREELRALASVIKAASDGELEAKLDEVLDTKRMYTVFALDAALGHWDDYFYGAGKDHGVVKGPNNFYLFYQLDDGRFVFLSHGMDRILEVPLGWAGAEVHPACSDKDDGDSCAYFEPETPKASLVGRRIDEIPAMKARFQGELSRIVTEVWDEEAILASIDQAKEVIRSASGAGEKTAIDLAEYDIHVGAFKDLIRARRIALDPGVVCGDFVVLGFETCDDGNTNDGDGCSSKCRKE